MDYSLDEKLTDTIKVYKTQLEECVRVKKQIHHFLALTAGNDFLAKAQYLEANYDTEGNYSESIIQKKKNDMENKSKISLNLENEEKLINEESLQIINDLEELYKSFKEVHC